MARRSVPILALCCTMAAAAEPGGLAEQVDVIPQPRQVTFAYGAFPVDDFCIVLVSQKATRGTRRAARAVQLGLRQRLGMDAPIVRISEQRGHGITRPIWVVEPRLARPPAKTIGVRGLAFTDEMKQGGYFVRVDALEAVLHGADDAGSYHAAQTFLQLIRPPRKATLFRKAAPPTIPCLWIQDWPGQPVRVIPSPFGPHENASIGVTGSMQLIELGAHYKLNALPRGLLPPDPATRARLEGLAAWRGIRIVEQAPPSAASPLVTALVGDAADPLRLRVAAQAEAAWGPPDPNAETFRSRLERDAAVFPTPRPPPPPEPKRDLLADDDDEGG